MDFASCFRRLALVVSTVCMLLAASPSSAQSCSEKWTDDDHELKVECVDHYFDGQSPAILFVFEAAGNHRKRARDNTEFNWIRLQVIQVLIFVLGATATFMIAVSGRENWFKGMNFGIWAALPTSIATVLTSVAAFYDWRGERVQQYMLAQNMATLRSQMNLDLLTLIASGDVPDRVDEVTMTIRVGERAGEEVSLTAYIQYAHDELDGFLRSSQNDKLQRMNNADIGGNN